MKVKGRIGKAMLLREYEIGLISSRIGALSDNKLVFIKVGKLRALIERNSVESAQTIYELQQERNDLQNELKVNAIIEVD